MQSEDIDRLASSTAVKVVGWIILAKLVWFFIVLNFLEPLNAELRKAQPDALAKAVTECVLSKQPPAERAAPKP